MGVNQARKLGIKVATSSSQTSSLLKKQYSSPSRTTVKYGYTAVPTQYFRVITSGGQVE
jgi:hypothetical protein